MNDSEIFHTSFRIYSCFISSLHSSCLCMTGIDVRAHDIRFVEDNWESPVIFFHLFSGSILSYIFSCILTNSKSTQFYLLVKYSCSRLDLSQKSFVLNIIMSSWFFFLCSPKNYFRCLVLGVWAGKFGWMEWRLPSSPTSSRYFF